MSKLETPLIKKYWENIGGTLIEEFQMVSRAKGRGHRDLDALILPNREKKWLKRWEATNIKIEGEDIILVQAKCNRLGMYLMGQAVFSVELMRKFNPKSIRSIALCTKDDEVVRPLLKDYPKVEVVVINK